jgi:hypothetical protein
MLRKNQTLQASPKTRARVAHRYSLANAPYQAQRRNFTSKRVSLRESVLKAFVWASL